MSDMLRNRGALGVEYFALAFSIASKHWRPLIDWRHPIAVRWEAEGGGSGINPDKIVFSQNLFKKLRRCTKDPLCASNRNLKYINHPKWGVRRKEIKNDSREGGSPTDPKFDLHRKESQNDSGRAGPKFAPIMICTGTCCSRVGSGRK